MNMERTLKNPILPGFYPDPSVCRRENDYYLVTSTFEYFPGIPVFHSKDFVHWHQLGHALSRTEQLNLDGISSSKGIYASSIFYDKGSHKFYIVSTLVKSASYWENENFYICADAPEGPWSDPVVIKGAEGIDPSLVFDGEKVYYLGNCRPFPEQPEKGRHIWLQELDLELGELTGTRWTLLTHGSVLDAAAPEGPHIYHIGDWYYLLIAEGGTFRNHASTIFRSRNLTGPYETNPKNPLISHSNLKNDYPIRNPGHADMIQLCNGEWWAVLLATRMDGGYDGNLGRETFAVPVEWNDGWPVFSPTTGRVEFSYPAPKIEEHIWEKNPDCEPFDGVKLPYEWLTIRTPRHNLYSLTERPGFLRMFLHPSTIKETVSCSFLGRRQQHMCFLLSAATEFEPEQEGETSGMVLWMNANYHIRLESGIFGGCKEIRLTMCFDGKDKLISNMPWNSASVYFKVTAVYQDINFYCSSDNENWNSLSEHVDGTLLSREVAGGYTGTILGLYASSNGNESKNFADFDWFLYQEQFE